jgi:predicted RNase H-like HicB family nuclease
MRIEYNVQIWKEGNQYVAHATPLDVMSSGTSPEDARRALDEAVKLFIVTAREQGTLEQILEECGYNVRDDVWVSPEWVSIERHTASVGG